MGVQKLYRVREGYRFGVGKQYGPGSIVSLTEIEASGFLDKLEHMGVVRVEVPAVEEPAGVVLVAGEEDTEPSPFVSSVAAPVILDEWLVFAELAKNLNMIRVLTENGYMTPDSVRGASDEELLALRGIGPKALATLRSILGVG